MDSPPNLQQPPTQPPASRSPTSRPQLASLANAGLSASSITTPRTLKRPRSVAFDPPHLTGAAALADQRRHQPHHADPPRTAHQPTQTTPSPQSSPNPAIAALNRLRAGPQTPSSRASEAPTANMESNRPPPPPTITTSAPVAEPMSIDHGNHTTTSPQSMSSTDGLGQRAAHALDLRPDETAHQQHGGLMVQSPGEKSNKAMSYPGLPPQLSDQHAPARQMSLPNPASARSSPNKRHKCPHCATEFTRHHNLKSHLLTHSQEKPYPCEQCNARFRRLHDLKRHGKLHTGERPHICDKCGRKFARGDALARHNKGPGGCAGRRSSIGDDDYVEGASGFGDHMDGIVYDNPEDMQDEEAYRRRKSEPGHRSRRGTIQSQGDAPSGPYRQHSSTYPGSMAVQNGRNQFAQPLPSPSHLSAGNSTPSYPGHQLPSNLPNGPITESPKPLSPGHADHRRLSAPNDLAAYAQGRSPNAQMHNPSYSRPGRSSPAPSLPPPVNTHPPQLPSLDRLTQPPEPRHANVQAPSGPSVPNFMPSQHGPQSASTTGSGSSNARSSAGSFREILNSGGAAAAGFPPEMALRETIRGLEQRVRTLEEDMRASERHYENRISRLSEENTKLKAQNDELQGQLQAPHHGGRP